MRSYTQLARYGLVSFLLLIDTLYQFASHLIPAMPMLTGGQVSRPCRQVLAAARSITILGLVLLLAGCSAPAVTDAAPLASGASGLYPDSKLSRQPVLEVVATTTVLADLAANVGGDLVAVNTLVPAGADVHTFQSTPADSLRISNAGVIVSNGAGLDDFLLPVLESARRPGSVMVLASGGIAAEYLVGDPHFWLDPILAQHYVKRIRDGLMAADPENSPSYEANARRYLRQLEELDQEVAATLSQVPEARRHLITFHDAYGHFARRYGWRISSFVASDASDVTPGAIVSILKQIKRDGIPAFFVEPQFSSGLMQQASIDSGVRLGTIRSLVDDQADTYLAMMRGNAQALAANLK